MLLRFGYGSWKGLSLRRDLNGDPSTLCLQTHPDNVTVCNLGLSTPVYTAETKRLVLVFRFDGTTFAWCGPGDTVVNTQILDAAVFNTRITPMRLLGSETDNALPVELHELNVFRQAKTNDEMLQYAVTLDGKWNHLFEAVDWDVMNADTVLKSDGTRALVDGDLVERWMSVDGKIAWILPSDADMSPTLNGATGFQPNIRSSSSTIPYLCLTTSPIRANMIGESTWVFVFSLPVALAASANRSYHDSTNGRNVACSTTRLGAVRVGHHGSLCGLTKGTYACNLRQHQCVHLRGR